MPIVLSPEEIRKTVPDYSDQFSFQADLSHGDNVTVSRKGPKDAFFQPMAVAKFVGGSLAARSGALVDDAEVSAEIWALLAALLPLDRVFGADHEDGSLDLLLVSGLPAAAKSTSTVRSPSPAWGARARADRARPAKPSHGPRLTA